MTHDNFATLALKKSVECATHAPSEYNAQPWLFRIFGNVVELWADPSRALPVADPARRELIISCGAALFHLRLGLEHYRFRPNVSRLPDPSRPDLLAVVEAGGMPEHSSEHLFQAILKRRTVRGSFEADRIPADEELSRLESAAQTEGANLSLLAENDRAYIAGLVAKADEMRGADPAYRRELASWMRTKNSNAPDGLRPAAFERLGISAWFTPLYLRYGNPGSRLAQADIDQMLKSPLIAMLSTDTDEPLAWLQTGEALARMLLEATVLGLSASFINQPLELPELREDLRTHLEMIGVPQLILRLGYATEPLPEATPRRRVDEVLRGLS